MILIYPGVEDIFAQGKVPLAQAPDFVASPIPFQIMAIRSSRSWVPQQRLVQKVRLPPKSPEGLVKSAIGIIRRYGTSLLVGSVRFPVLCFVDHTM
jgi:hypothetical protein